MPFNLTIGTERAAALQQSIQDELMKRGYSTDAAQITSELEDLIGSDFGTLPSTFSVWGGIHDTTIDASFTDWLFAEAARGAPVAEAVAPAELPTPSRPAEHSENDPPNASTDTPVRAVNASRSAGIYQQALSQAASSAQKRTASARSLSPNHPNKSRRTDLPTGPRAMNREVQGPSRSLMDRISKPRNSGGNPASNNQNNGFTPRDDIQARIDNITSNDPNLMMAAGNFPMGMGIDMNMVNPMMLQEVIKNQMNQMAIMAQMASSIGMMNPSAGQFNGAGFPMQGNVPPEFMNGGMGGFSGNDVSGRGRGNVRRGRGGSTRGGRGGGSSSSSQAVDLGGANHAPNSIPHLTPTSSAQPLSAIPITVVAPAPAVDAAAPVAHTIIPFAVPERPQSPTLCKFGPKCTNANCRWSHPSPVATAESGVVLSNQACEKGKDCKDRDCIYAHVSPAVLKPHTAETQAVQTLQQNPPPAPAVSAATPCRFGAACTRPNCSFSHPVPNNHFAQQCRFGSGCTRATCPFQHPPGRVLPTTFHRGLSSSSPVVSVKAPETGSIGAPSPHRSVKFNNPSNLKEKLAQRMKELEGKKKEAEDAVKEAKAAATGKGDSNEESKPVAIAA